MLAAQSVHEAPANAPSTGRLTPAGEPGTPMHVSGVVVGPDGAPIAGASLYVYQTDHEGYYGVKPATDNRNPRLKMFLRIRCEGRVELRHGPAGVVSANSKLPAHIHFEVSAKGYANRIVEIVFEGDPYVTAGDAQESGVLSADDRGGRAGDGADRDGEAVTVAWATVRIAM